MAISCYFKRPKIMGNHVWWFISLSKWVIILLYYIHVLKKCVYLCIDIIYIYIYVYVCIDIYIYVCIYIYIYIIYIYKYKNVFIYIYTDAFIYRSSQLELDIAPTLSLHTKAAAHCGCGVPDRVQGCERD